jgi:hypothetical protein
MHEYPSHLSLLLHIIEAGISELAFELCKFFAIKKALQGAHFCVIEPAEGLVERL